jgi:hypothetical protein
VFDLIVWYLEYGSGITADKHKLKSLYTNILKMV